MALRAGSSKREINLQLNGIFNTNDMHIMLLEKAYQINNIAVLFICFLVNIATGYTEDGELTKVSELKQEVVVKNIWITWIKKGNVN